MDLRASIVRILVASDEKATAGTGFIVTEAGHIATCAHVVNDAGSGPGGTVGLVFHTTKEKKEATVEAEYWTDPAAEDVAILRLRGQLPEGETPLPLGTSDVVKGHPFETFGFTRDKPIEGDVGVGEIIGESEEAGFPVLQLRSEEITKGFSGAPLWEEKLGLVIGMVTSIKGTKKQKIDGKTVYLPSDPSWRGLTTAYATTVETIRGACSILALPDSCPYRGLEVFEDQHADHYFGREAAVRELLQMLTERDFVTVVGVSGSGKSSLVRAGLKKGLRESSVPGLVELAERPPCIFKASSTPLLDLVVALSGLPTQTTERVTHSFGLQVGALSDDPEARRQTDAYLRKQSPEALARSLRECVRTEELLLIIDQFERLYTECQDEITHLRFIETLLASAGDGVKIIVVLRADFYGLALQHPSLAHVIKDGQVTMLPMSDDELRRAIVAPAKAVLRSFRPGLVERLVTDVRGQAGNLPLLEFALTELWRLDADKGVLTTESYEGLGYTSADGRRYPGVHGAIAKRAEDVWRFLDSEERRAATRVFLSLVAPGPAVERTHQIATDVSNRALYEELDEPSKRVVDKLTDARLLTKGEDPISQQPTVEVAHEALIRAWPKLQGWVGKYESFIRWRRNDLTPYLQRWLAKHRSQDFLLPAAMLDEAVRRLAEYADELSGPPTDYIRASEESLKQEEQRWKDLAESETRQRREAERQRDEAERQRRIALAGQLAAQAELLGIQRAPSLQRSVLLAIEAMKLSPSLQAEQILRRALDLMALPIVTVHHGASQVEDVALSPDGGHLAAAGEDGTVSVWEVASGEEVGRVPHDGVTSVALNANGGYLATVSRDRTAEPSEVKIWKVASGKQVGRALHDGVTSIAFSPDGKHLATANRAGTVRVAEVPEGKEVRRMISRDKLTSSLVLPRWQDPAFSADGTYLAALGVPKDWLTDARFETSVEIRVWLVASGEEVSTRKGVKERSVSTRNGMAVSGNGEHIAATSAGDTVSVWEVASGEVVGRVPHDGVTSVALSASGTHFATAGGGSTVMVWRVCEDEMRFSDLKNVESVAASPEGKHIAITERSFTIIGGSMVPPRDTIRVVEVPGGEEVARVPHAGMVSTVALSTGGNYLVFRSEDNTVRMWKVASSEELLSLGYGRAWSIAVSPEGKHLAIADLNGTVRVVEVPGGEEVARVPHAGTGSAVAFGAEGEHLVIADMDYARVVEIPGGEEVARVLYDTGAGQAVAFSADRDQLVTSSGWDVNFGVIGVWEATSGKGVNRIRIPDHAERYVRDLTLNPDGEHFATASGDIARVWQAISGQEVARVPHEVVSKVAFSGDGKHLLTLSEEVARVVYWRPEDLIREACSRLTRNLTPQEWSTYFGEQPYRKTCSNLS